MTVQASITINASRAAVWAAITDVAGFAQLLSGVQKIEIIERPVAGLVGLKWKETRMLFGKEATVEKTIIAAAENEFYTTVARDAGFVFTTYQRIADHEGPLILRSIHETVSQGFTARLKALPMVFFKGVIRKAIMQDLEDIKAAINGSVRAPRSGREQVALLCTKLTSENHHEHEDIIRALQLAADPYSIPYLKQAILLKPRLTYLEYDDYGAYYKKCFWALAAIGTEEAMQVIRDLSRSDNTILREQALYRLSRPACS